MSACARSYAIGGARGDRASTTGAAGSASSSGEGIGAVVGDQKSASIAVCASKSANIGTAAIAVKAKIAMQTMMTVRERITLKCYCGSRVLVLGSGCRF